MVKNERLSEVKTGECSAPLQNALGARMLFSAFTRKDLYISRMEAQVKRVKTGNGVLESAI